METFISCVRAEPCLWNTLHHEYREVPVRDAAWQRIVNKCKNDAIPSVKVARSTWRRIRDNHREALKRAMLGQNKLLPAQITTWKYAKAMQFLEPHMKYRITENIEPEATDEVEAETPEPDVTTSHSAEPLNLQQSSATQGSPPRKRFCAETNDSLRPPHHDGDALESFFNYMLKSTREMPSWMQTQVKKKIFAVLIEAEEQISSNDNNENNDELLETRSTFTHIKTEVFTEDSCDYT